jgi:hypothetical protein
MLYIVCNIPFLYCFSSNEQTTNKQSSKQKLSSAQKQQYPFLPDKSRGMIVRSAFRDVAPLKVNKKQRSTQQLTQVKG